ncbi:GNAT family N-acetyltransferase [Paenibacillus durus]|uniref:GCN5 family acetyltransferase n=1 Tax=Paenibacillus durus ATCC 35681 TaxID=1333534 RepID=A0A0F7F9I1_PAEDU|nr:GNAT family protein [Paenibacillus durus]AKG34727.1 GCN5 family acetyltransferase [Paenibacillus durus ATCC 35681]
MEVTFRELVPGDAEELLRLQHSLDEETAFMLLEPGERQTDVQQVQDMIEGFVRSKTSNLIGAEVDGQLAGYVLARGGSVNRNRHSAYLVIGLLKRYQGMGVGSGLLRELIAWAEESGLVRLELTVMKHNERAIALYTKCGFTAEGTKVKSLKVDGAWVDELYMSKIIGFAAQENT